MIAANIEDLRRAAKRRLPRMLFDFMDGGAFAEETLRANERDFDRWTLEQRVMVDVRRRGLAAPVLGMDCALPLLLGPTGSTGLLRRDGEILAARAAHAAGMPYCLSTFSIRSLEEVRAATPGPLLFQLYMLRDRALVEALLARAKAADFAALIVTADTAVSGRREKDLRNGFLTSPRPSLPALLDMLWHVPWLTDVMLGPTPLLGNFRDLPGAGRTMRANVHHVGALLDTGFAWHDLDWLRARWPGKLVVKGLLHPDDARRAVDAGADAVIVSNHGGRQLDAAPSSISMLPAVVGAVGGQAEVWLDSGIRRGQHVVKALALGAHACLLGRAFLYGIAADGQRGAARAIDLIRFEIDVTLGLMGITSIAELRAPGGAHLKARTTAG